MELLKKKILECGEVCEGDVLKVGSFLNQQIDTQLLFEMAKELHERFSGCEVSKVLTIEASGIGIACFTAYLFGCPAVFAKKSKTSNISGSVYSSTVVSYTHGTTSDVLVPKSYLSPNDNVLIVDDFIANGYAAFSLIDIVSQSQAKLSGVGILVEKAYQNGADAIRRRGIRVESLARIASMSVENGITFC